MRLRIVLCTWCLALLRRPVLTIVVFWSLVIATTASYAEPLAVVHSGCVAGDAIDKCTGTKYDVPKPADLVRECGSLANCWSAGTPIARVFSALPGTTVIDACDTPTLIRGTVVQMPYVPAVDPCTTWKPVLASTFSALPPGTVTVSWVLDAAGDPATSVWLYSGVKGGALGRIKQVSLPASSAVLPGYVTPGIYTFGVTAANAAGESAMTSLDYTVAPILKAPSKPASLSITAVTLQ